MKPRDRIDLKGEMKERMIDMVPAEPLWAVFKPEVIQSKANTLAEPKVANPPADS